MTHRNLFSLEKWENMNRIVYDLYNETGDLDDVFTKFFNSLRNIISYDKANIFFYRYKNESFEIESFLPVDWKPTLLQRYLDYYYQIDDILPILSTNHHVMSRSTETFEIRERKKTKYYKELIKPAGIDYSIDGNIYVEETAGDPYYGGIGIFRSSEKKNFSTEDLYVMKLIQPHLFKVVYNQELNKQRINLAYCLDILHQTNHIGIGILNSERKLIFSNNKLEKNLSETESFPQDNHEIIEKIRYLCNQFDEHSITHLETKIELDETSYFVELSMVKSNNTFGKDRFIALVYDVPNMLSSNLLQLKDQNNLSQREFEVVQYVLKGLNNKQISEKMFISLPTVKKHLSAAYAKLGLKGRNQIWDHVL